MDLGFRVQCLGFRVLGPSKDNSHLDFVRGFRDATPSNGKEDGKEIETVYMLGTAPPSSLY